MLKMVIGFMDTGLFSLMKRKPKNASHTLEDEKKRVRCVDTDEEFESVRDAAERMGVTSSCITNCIIQGWKVKGMMFEYAQ